MERLTLRVIQPAHTFRRCQLCGHSSSDICEFTMWIECDDNDVPERGNIIILCRKDACAKVLDAHPRLYVEVPWSQGGPGMFMLTCGECKYRDKAKCTNPQLKTNGGPGLEVRVDTIMPAIVCFNNGTSKYVGRHPVHECLGFEDGKK